jgi:hypothetical protein
LLLLLRPTDRPAILPVLLTPPCSATHPVGKAGEMIVTRNHKTNEQTNHNLCVPSQAKPILFKLSFERRGDGSFLLSLLSTPRRYPTANKNIYKPHLIAPTTTHTPSKYDGGGDGEMAPLITYHSCQEGGLLGIGIKRRGQLLLKLGHLRIKMMRRRFAVGCSGGGSLLVGLASPAVAGTGHATTRSSTPKAISQKQSAKTTSQNNQPRTHL